MILLLVLGWIGCGLAIAGAVMADNHVAGWPVLTICGLIMSLGSCAATIHEYRRGS